MIGYLPVLRQPLRWHEWRRRRGGERKSGGGDEIGNNEKSWGILGMKNIGEEGMRWRQWPLSSMMNSDKTRHDTSILELEFFVLVYFFLCFAFVDDVLTSVLLLIIAGLRWCVVSCF